MPWTDSLSLSAASLRRSAVVALALLVAAPLGALSLATGAKAQTAPTGQSTLLAQDEDGAPPPGKRKKKKKKRKKKGDAGGEDPAAGGGGGDIHAKQEGKDEPYAYEVSLLSDFAITNRTIGEAKDGYASYYLSARMLYIIAQSFEIGGGLDYDETSSKSKGADDETVTNTSSDYLISILAIYNFGNLDTDTMVFFAGLGLGFGSGKDKTGDVTSTSSKTQFGLNLGLRYFVDSNVALTGEFSYDTGSEKIQDVDDPAKFSTIHLMKIGFSLFL